MRVRLRRTVRRIVRSTVDRLRRCRRPSPSQRARLLADVREDLEAMVDDAENRRVTERAAREMLAARSLVGWLEGDDARPGAEAIRYLKRTAGLVAPEPGEDELAVRRTYLAAIDELVGHEASSRAGIESSGAIDEDRVLPDLQGRLIRGLMEERGLTVGGLARRSGIDTVTLVSLLFGLEMMGTEELIRLSGALGVPTGDLVPDGPASSGRLTDGGAESDQ